MPPVYSAALLAALLPDPFDPATMFSRHDPPRGDPLILVGGGARLTGAEPAKGFARLGAGYVLGVTHGSLQPALSLVGSLDVPGGAANASVGVGISTRPLSFTWQVGPSSRDDRIRMAHGPLAVFHAALGFGLFVQLQNEFGRDLTATAGVELLSTTSSLEWVGSALSL